MLCVPTEARFLNELRTAASAAAVRAPAFNTRVRIPAAAAAAAARFARRHRDSTEARQHRMSLQRQAVVSCIVARNRVRYPKITCNASTATKAHSKCNVYSVWSAQNATLFYSLESNAIVCALCAAAALNVSVNTPCTFNRYAIMITIANGNSLIRDREREWGAFTSRKKFSFLPFKTRERERDVLTKAIKGL